jgi:hypothetical protein
MLAGGSVGSPDWTLLAAGPRSAVLADSGDNRNLTHNANGTEWYFSTNWSWGFANGGEAVNRDSCDLAPTTNVHLRLCWHTYSGNLSSGYRIGTNINTNSGLFERAVL